MEAERAREGHKKEKEREQRREEEEERAAEGRKWREQNLRKEVFHKWPELKKDGKMGGDICDVFIGFPSHLSAF